MFGIAVALAAQVAPYSTTTPEVAIDYWARFYNVDATQMYETIKCESAFDPKTVGPYGELGVAQIYLKYHPDVTKEQAVDPDFSVRWMAKSWSQGHKSWWVCYNLLYAKDQLHKEV